MMNRAPVNFLSGLGFENMTGPFLIHSGVTDADRIVPGVFAARIAAAVRRLFAPPVKASGGQFEREEASSRRTQEGDPARDERKRRFQVRDNRTWSVMAPGGPPRRDHLNREEFRTSVIGARNVCPDQSGVRAWEGCWPMNWMMRVY
jgi:hypothetical protein